MLFRFAQQNPAISSGMRTTFIKVRFCRLGEHLAVVFSLANGSMQEDSFTRMQERYLIAGFTLILNI